jgi:hypothetical protein
MMPAEIARRRRKQEVLRLCRKRIRWKYERISEAGMDGVDKARELGDVTRNEGEHVKNATNDKICWVCAGTNLNRSDRIKGDTEGPVERVMNGRAVRGCHREIPINIVNRCLLTFI